MTPEERAAQAIRDSEPVALDYQGHVAIWLVTDRLEEQIAQAITAAVRDERQACADLAETWRLHEADVKVSLIVQEIALAIQARGV
jgi:hypothetical protein